MRVALCLIFIGCAAAQGALASATERPQRTIPCNEIIFDTRFPYPPFRLVLGAVSVPPAYLKQTHRSVDVPLWPYFAKQGIVVKSGRSVTITVPRAWRKRVAISWGNNVHRVFHTIRIAACSQWQLNRAMPKRGYAYAGGFHLRQPSGCVPLVFVVGSRRQTVWFGIGTPCR